MNKKTFVIFAILIMVTTSAQADSIWAKRGKNTRFTFADDTAKKIGDVLTIVVTENSKIDNKAKRDMQKDTSRSVTFNGELGGFTDLGEFGMSSSSDNSLKGKADFKDERKFTDNVTVMVVDVMPNNNLVIMGTRYRDISDDIQEIEISGIVRPSDIGFDNTVRSEQVANFKIVSNSKGVAAKFNKPGFLGGILDAMWPF